MTKKQKAAQKKAAESNKKRNSEILANLAAPPKPVAPASVAPTPNADDMITVSNWLSDYYRQIEDIDFGIQQLETDTKYAKGKNDKDALENRSASDDAMAARGIFRSSLRDAATYDIEATRSLANTYLDTKLNEAVTAGTTRKGTLASAKTAFETGMAAKYAENVAPINASNNDAYASALAAYKPPPAIRAIARPPAAKPAAKPTAPQVAHRSATTTVSNAASQAIKAAKPKAPPKPKKP